MTDDSILLAPVVGWKLRHADRVRRGLGTRTPRGIELFESIWNDAKSAAEWVESLGESDA